MNNRRLITLLGKKKMRNVSDPFGYLELPGCSLCMGNQAQIRKGSTAMSTSTRNFPNRLGIDTNVYLGSAELAAICALMGRIPSVAEYQAQMTVIQAQAADVYRYMNFDRIADFVEVAATVKG